MRGSTPSFSRPSGFKTNVPSLNTNPESVPRDRDNNLWSLAPLKDSHVSPAESAEIKGRKSNRSEKNLSEDKKLTVKESSNILNTVSKVESMEIETNTRKEGINESKQGKEKRNSAEMVESSSGIKIRNIHHKFQRILLSDSSPTTPSNKLPTTNLIHLGSPELKSPPQNVYNYHLPDGSPPKTLNFLDVPFANDSCTKKSLDLPDQTLLSASTTNIYSIGTISNLVNLCKGRDGRKKGDFERKFKTNLVDLIKDSSITKTREETPKIERPNVELSKTATSEKENPASSIEKGRKYFHRPSIEKSVVANSLTKSTLSNNLLSLVKDEQPKRIRSHHKHKSMQINHNNKEDIFEDMIGPSPLHKGDNLPGNKYTLPPLPWVAHLNSSISKNSDSVFLHDKTIYNFDEQASRMDWDRYSICEQINNVEIDDRSFNHSNLDVGSLTRIEGLETQTPHNLNTSAINATDFLEPKTNDMCLLKTKSVPNGKSEENDNLSQTKTPWNKNLNNLNESISTIQYLSPIQGPRTQNPQPVVRVNRRTISYSRAGSQVIETNRVDKSVDEDGQKKINQYILIKEIGRGGFGKVKLAINADTKKQYVFLPKVE